MLVAGAACDGPTTPTGLTIWLQPQGQTIAAGATATLRVAGSGATPIGYQWYIGPRGSTIAPIPGAVSADYTTASLLVTTSYWVRVSNASATVDSDTAVITVVGPAGTAPAITGHPRSQTISSGAVAILTVAANGTAPLSYQWFAGPAQDVSAPIAGATASTYTTPVLTVSSTFWVRVSNAHGSADSATAAITVAAPPPSPDPATVLEDEVFALVNQRRAAGGTCGGTALPAVPPLSMNPNLRLAARGHSLDMATQNYVSHISLDGRTFDQRIRDAGYTGSFPLAENIAAGHATPQAVVDAWMASPGHCANIMSPGFRAVGVGYAHNPSSTYRHYWTQSFGGS
jgi:uncharacterized protein YkwD